MAIEKEVPGVDWSTASKELLAQEALDVYRMYLMEQLREHYFNEEKCAILVLECESKAQAQELLGKLPLVEKTSLRLKLWSYTLIPAMIGSFMLWHNNNSSMPLRNGFMKLNGYLNGQA